MQCSSGHKVRVTQQKFLGAVIDPQAERMVWRGLEKKRDPSPGLEDTHTWPMPWSASLFARKRLSTPSGLTTRTRLESSMQLPSASIAALLFSTLTEFAICVRQKGMYTLSISRTRSKKEKFQRQCESS